MFHFGTDRKQVFCIHQPCARDSGNKTVTAASAHGMGSGGLAVDAMEIPESLYLMIVLLLFLQNQNLATAIYLSGPGTLLSGLGLKHMRIRSHHDLAGTLVTPLLLGRPW
jgi:hypothetical protein